jgi:hypothetical protein
LSRTNGVGGSRDRISCDRSELLTLIGANGSNGENVLTVVCLLHNNK